MRHTTSYFVNKCKSLKQIWYGKKGTHPAHSEEPVVLREETDPASDREDDEEGYPLPTDQSGPYLHPNNSFDTSLLAHLDIDAYWNDAYRLAAGYFPTTPTRQSHPHEASTSQLPSSLQGHDSSMPTPEGPCRTLLPSLPSESGAPPRLSGAASSLSLATLADYPELSLPSGSSTAPATMACRGPPSRRRTAKCRVAQPGSTSHPGPAKVRVKSVGSARGIGFLRSKSLEDFPEYLRLRASLPNLAPLFHRHTPPKVRGRSSESSDHCAIDFLTELPPELSLQILSQLDAESLTRAALVSRDWHGFTLDPLLWRQAFLQQSEWTYTYGLTPGTRSRPTATSPQCTSSLPAPSEPRPVDWTPPTSPSNGVAPMDISTESVGWTAEGAVEHRPPKAAPLSPMAIDSVHSDHPEQEWSSSSPTHRLSTWDDMMAGIRPWRTMYQQRHRLEKRWTANGPKTVHYLNGHSDSVYCLQFNDDLLVTGSRDRTVKFWDLRDDYRCTRTLAGHEGSVLCLKYDARHLVTGSSDFSVMVWDMDQPPEADPPPQGPVMQLRSHIAGVLDVAMSDQTIVSCSKDCTIKLWNRANGDLLRSIPAHRRPVNAIQISGHQMVSASGDGLVNLWDVETGNYIRSFEGHLSGLACVQFKDNRILSGSNDKTIKMWDPRTSECVSTLTGHQDLVRTLHYAGGQRLVSGSYDQTVKIWDLAANKCNLSLDNGHSSWVFDVQCDLTRLISAGQDQKILVWEFAPDLDDTLLVA